jgi:hypothetical protein
VSERVRETERERESKREKTYTDLKSNTELLRTSTLEGGGRYIARKMNNTENRISAGRRCKHSPQKKKTVMHR